LTDAAKSLWENESEKSSARAGIAMKDLGNLVHVEGKDLLAVTGSISWARPGIIEKLPLRRDTERGHRTGLVSR
jgi:hypothetical protein